ncbi:DNA-binding SARP family transcriptional activator/Flp pilus assembly protein TadD [Deinococcus sp. UYEF24]
MKTVVADYEQLYNAGLYEEAVTALAASPSHDARAAAILAVSTLRLGNYTEAENLLETAMYLGDLEASVEYGNCLRAVGRLEDAAIHLTEVLPSLKGELEFRAIRWTGVINAQLGKSKEALKLLERAKRGYSALQDKLNEAKVSQSLAGIYDDIGDKKKARQLLESAIIQFRLFGSKNLLLLCLRNLISVYISLNELEQANRSLAELEEHVGNCDSPASLFLWVSKSIIIANDPLRRAEYVSLIDKTIAIAGQYGNSENLVWGIVKKVEYLLQSDNTSDAMRLLYQSPQDENGQFPTSIRIVRAMINRRMGNLHEAIEELRSVGLDLEASGNVAELARVRLQLAYALHLDGQAEASADVLRAALQGLLRTNIHPSMRPELEELSELLHFAALEPSLAPYLEPVMDSLAGVLGGADNGNEGERVRLQVHTLGRVSILKGGDPVTFQLKGTVPLLVYLALTPNRTIQEILLDLYPDKEPTTGSAYVRKSIQELRELLGHGAVLTEGPRNQSRYRLGPSLQLDLDLTRYLDAINRAETARALALYRGEFLPGSDESEWVLQKRDEARLALTFELHNQMVAFREAHEWRRVILLANQYLRVEPHEPSVHALRVEAARRVGTAAELGRFVAAMNSSSN